MTKQNAYERAKEEAKLREMQLRDKLELSPINLMQIKKLEKAKKIVKIKKINNDSKNRLSPPKSQTRSNSDGRESSNKNFELSPEERSGNIVFARKQSDDPEMMKLNLIPYQAPVKPPAMSIESNYTYHNFVDENHFGQMDTFDSGKKPKIEVQTGLSPYSASRKKMMLSPREDLKEYMNLEQ